MKTILLSLLATSGILSAEDLFDMSPSEGAVPLFDGKTLDGWKTSEFDKKFWWAKDGEIQGGDLEKNVPANVWLISEKEYENFELTFSVKLTDGGGADLLKNSGVQVRSLPIGKSVCGYQIDAGPTHPKNSINNGLGYWGNIWDEHRRGPLVVAMNQDKLKESVKQWDWNQYKVTCNGKNIKTYINGILAHDYTEENPKIADMGVIALQAHAGGKFLVHFKDLMIKELPSTEGAVKWTDEGVIKSRVKKKRAPKAKKK
ncbi:DUF1080 domain-containing protein [bacterium]|nr:DUF1080 domain-containing protein [bacterium]